MEVRILQVNVGKPRVIGVHPRTGEVVMSAIGKLPVAGTHVTVTTRGIEGDQQTDLSVHGGEEKAVYMLPAEHLVAWKRDTGIDFYPGLLGENLTVRGVTEEGIRMGDLFVCGDVLLQVTKPRRPCIKLVLHTGIDDMAARMMDTGRCGCYLRVIQPGQLPTSGMLQLVETDPNQPTIADVFYRREKIDPNTLAQA